ncbi:unnamed protein product [Gadus morhua 'NCC']
MDSGAVLRRNRRHLQALPGSADSSEEQQLRARPTPLPSGSSSAASPALSDKPPDQMSPDRAVGHAYPHTPPGGGTAPGAAPLPPTARDGYERWKKRLDDFVVFSLQG